MDEPKITKEQIKLLYDHKYLKLYGIDLSEKFRYMMASRRSPENLTVLKTGEDYSTMLPDAVTIILVVKTPGDQPRLYLEHEYRYPTAHFLLSPPAGLIDKDDGEGSEALIKAAKREIYEETGIKVKDSDRIEVVSPLFFSSPGMTDESNGIVLAEVELSDLSSLTNDNAEGTECFDGYSLVTKDEAEKLINNARDENGHYFSIFTWAILLFFAHKY